MISSIRNIALIAFFTLVSVFDINAAKASTEENSAPQVVTTQDNPESYGRRDYPVYQKQITNVNINRPQDESLSQKQVTNINISDPKSAKAEQHNPHFYIGASAIGGLKFDTTKSLGATNDSVAILGLQVRTGYEFGLGQQFFVATELFYNAFFYSNKLATLPNVNSIQSMFGFRLRPGVAFGESSKLYGIIGAVGGIFVGQTKDIERGSDNFDMSGSIKPGVEIGIGVATKLTKYLTLRVDATYTHFFDAANRQVRGVDNSNTQQNAAYYDHKQKTRQHNSNDKECKEYPDHYDAQASVTVPLNNPPQGSNPTQTSDISQTSVFGAVLGSIGLDFYPFAGL